MNLKHPFSFAALGSIGIGIIAAYALLDTPSSYPEPSAYVPFGIVIGLCLTAVLYGVIRSINRT